MSCVVSRVREMKVRFNAELLKRHCDLKNSVFLTDERYYQLIKDVDSAKSKTKKKEPRDYWLLKKYDVLVVNNNSKLINPVKNNDNNILYYTKESDVFDVLHDAHQSLGHGGRDRMLYELNSKFKNITRFEVDLYLSLCEQCQLKHKKIRKGLVVKPIISSEFNSRCQVDLIDFQSNADQLFKFIMVYQDHLTKFVVIKPLKTKTAEEVAYNLIDIFTLLGAPSILQSDNGREFSNQIVSNLKNYWPNLKIVHGKPRHSQSQGSVERANQDIQNMLMTWMRDNNTSKWSEGLRFIQLMKNRAYHKGINRSPYEALFGCKMKVGLDTSFLPPYILKDLDDEESLLKLVDHNSIIPTNQYDGNIITNNEDIITTINEDICTVDNNINTGNFTDNENITTNDEDIITTINKDICTFDNSINNGNYLVCSEENDKNIVQCSTCDRKIHASGTVENDLLLCKLCTRTKKTENQRKEAHCNLELQAIKMKTRSNKKFPPALVGNTVRVPISDVDRGRGEAHNILACVLEVTEDGFYRLGNKTGTYCLIDNYVNFSLLFCIFCICFH